MSSRRSKHEAKAARAAKHRERLRRLYEAESAELQDEIIEQLVALDRDPPRMEPIVRRRAPTFALAAMALALGAMGDGRNHRS